MDNDKKETVGKLAFDLMSKPQENSDPIAQGKAMLVDYEKNLNQAYDRGKAQFGGNFYIVVITKKERLMQNVIRNYFLVRESCPTPDFDQTVYRIVRKDNKIELLWVVPCVEACEQIKLDPLGVPEEEIALRNNVLSFYDGTLESKCRKLNGELKESTVSDSFNPKDFEHHENLIIQS